jgi:hypothetical protein
MELPHGTFPEIPGTAVPPGAASAAQPTWRVAAAATPPRAPGPKKKTRKIGKNWGKIGKHGMNNGIKMLQLGGSDDNSVFLCIQSSSSGGKKGTLSTIMGEFRSFSMGNCNDNGDK